MNSAWKCYPGHLFCFVQKLKGYIAILNNDWQFGYKYVSIFVEPLNRTK